MIIFKLIFEGQQYCIEIIDSPHYPADGLLILKNDQVVDAIFIDNIYVDTHKTCFDSFDEENDTIEIRDGGGYGGGTISINLIKEGVKTKLLSRVIINRDRLECGSNYEYAPAVKIKDGNVIQSCCKG